MNIKIIFLKLFVLLVFGQNAFAQITDELGTRYGNEWINYDQKYIKIRLAEEGIYRISYQSIQQSHLLDGIDNPLGSGFQLFFRGQEVPIRVSNNDRFGNGDYIEFYGAANDGWLDQFLYIEPSYQLNPDYSMFSDTSAYFLTWENVDNHLRYDITESDFSSSFPKPTHCIVEQKVIFSEQYGNGKEYGSSERIVSQYDLGEGFGSSGYLASRDIFVDIAGFVTNVGTAKMKIRNLSNSGKHIINYNVNGVNYIQDEFTDWAIREHTFDVPSNTLRSRNVVSIRATGSDNDKYKIASVRMEYPHGFDFRNLSELAFQLQGNSSPQYLEITNFNHQNNAPLLYDLTNRRILQTSIQNGLVKVVVPASEQPLKLLLVSQGAVKTASVANTYFTKYNFEDGNYNYIILTNTRLFDDGNGNNYVQEYADYRASSAGGAYRPIIVDVEQIYDQFGYGIKYHEQASRNFLKLASNAWDVKHLFILGKGANKTYTRSKDKYQKWHGGSNYTYEDWQAFDLVPSFGYPHSDYLLAMDHNQFVPRMAVGRIAAYTPDQVRLYLKKVKEFEAVQNMPQTIEEKAWTKRIVHFAGGDIRIQDQIKYDLDSLARILANSSFGATSSSFYKTSTDVIQELQTDVVNRVINEGNALLTFFGHSAPQTLDFDVGKAEQYNTKGKYPIFYAIGCNSNQVLNLPSTLSEEYVLIEDKGVIGYLGTMWTTELSNLSRYARILYQNLGEDYYGETFGEIIRQTMDEYTVDASFVTNRVKEIMMFHGDPALRLYPHEQPDYLVNLSKTFISPNPLSLQQDSFKLDLTVSNIGKAANDSISIAIYDITPDGASFKIKSLRIAAPKFEEQFQINLALQKSVAGKHTIEIVVDADNQIKEIEKGEANNKASVSLFVIDYDIEPVYPNNFAIVNQQGITLKASTTSVFTTPINYHFEIDTTLYFNSPIKTGGIVQDAGGVIEWKPNSLLQEGKVYYWRVSIDSTLTSGKGFNWKNSSFTYLPLENNGWNQSHFQQLLQNELKAYIIDTATQLQRFGNFLSEFKVTTGVFGNLAFEEVSIFIDGFRFVNYWPCPNGGITNNTSIWMLGFNKDTHLYRQLTPSGEKYNCWENPGTVFISTMAKQQDRAQAIEFINNYVPDNDYVFMFTTQFRNTNHFANQWAADSIELGTNVFQMLEQQGAKQVRKLADFASPYILIFQKNNPNFEAIEVRAQDLNTNISAEVILPGSLNGGSIISAPVGPANSWQKLVWQVSEQEPSDKVNIDVYGITTEGEHVLLLNQQEARTVDLHTIDATQYPYLQLYWNATDSTNHTALQLDHWRVLYEPLPDVALAPNLDFDFQADTLQQGELLHLGLTLANTSSTDMDSILMKYVLIDENNQERIFWKRVAPIPAFGRFYTTWQFDTELSSGKYQLIVEANPNQEQKESHLFNNIGVLEFFVEGDQRNPVLDVLFDGRRIKNRDIVSTTPLITIDLRDENQFLILNDTALFDIQITFPDGKQQTYFFDHPAVRFYPASSTQNVARVTLMPNLLDDGIYTLSVTATDRSGNQAGQYAYNVDFEVTSNASVSEVSAYPNPFSTSTQFVFQLSGKQLPEDIRIQIMDISGKLIRELVMDELGLLRIGNNQTAFDWDGTDQFGKRLASGVYVYRVLIRDKATDNANDKLDISQYPYVRVGKVVLMR